MSGQCVKERGMNDHCVRERGMHEQYVKERGMNEQCVKERGMNEQCVKERGMNEQCVKERGMNEHCVKEGGREGGIGRARFCRAPRHSSADVLGVLELRHGLVPTVHSSAPTYLRLQRGARDRANSNGLTVFLRSGLSGRRISPEKGHPGSRPWAGGPGVTPTVR